MLHFVPRYLLNFQALHLLCLGLSWVFSCFPLQLLQNFLYVKKSETVSEQALLMSVVQMKYQLLQKNDCDRNFTSHNFHTRLLCPSFCNLECLSMNNLRIQEKFIKSVGGGRLHLSTLVRRLMRKWVGNRVKYTVCLPWVRTQGSVVSKVTLARCLQTMTHICSIRNAGTYTPDHSNSLSFIWMNSHAFLLCI